MKRIMDPHSIVAMIVIVIFLSSDQALAYIDAGTSGLVFQIGYVFFILFFSTIAFIPKKIFNVAKRVTRKILGMGNEQDN